MRFTLIALFMLNFIQGCAQRDYNMYNIELFKDTPVWELAKAVDGQDIAKITKLIKKQKLPVDYKEPKFDSTLLMWAIFNGKYDSFISLLKNGADPNAVSGFDGNTPLTLAANYYHNYQRDSRYLKMLLKEGADPNKVTYNKENGNTPISAIDNAVTNSVEYTRILIESGVDVNFTTEGYPSILEEALKAGELDVVYYLLVEKHAKANLNYSTINGAEYPLARLLRYWSFPLDSEEYKKKMKIVEEFTKQGQDYWKTDIPKDELENIKRNYPDSWETYILKY